ncbi:MAG: response regulator [Gammaproteobacteria bacterium]|nr:response regulator [Gammaproteobacteria bacterium]
MPTKDYLSPNEVARMLKVSPITVRQWASRGLIDATTTGAGIAVSPWRRSAASPRSVASFCPDAGGPVRRVLVVDDDRQLNRFLVELINAWSRRMQAELEVDSAHDGFEAGSKVHTFDPDVVLLDLMMPGVDGFEVCQRLKSDTATCHMRVVAMTGYYSPDRVQRILASGADRFLRKPFSNAEVLEACGLTESSESLGPTGGAGSEPTLQVQHG